MEVIFCAEKILMLCSPLGMVKWGKEGREEGIKEGREEEKRTIARNMKSFGMTPEAIAQMTGLSLEEIEAI